MLYCMPKGLEIAFMVRVSYFDVDQLNSHANVTQLLERRGLVRRLPGSSVLIFCVAVALLLMTDRRDHKKMYASLLRFFFGEDDTSLADVLDARFLRNAVHTTPSAAAARQVPVSPSLLPSLPPSSADSEPPPALAAE